MSPWTSISDLTLGMIDEGFWLLTFLVKSVALLLSSFLVTLICGLCVICYKRKKSWKYMKHFPGVRELVPFHSQWTIHKVCLEMPPGGSYAANLFNVICGLHFTFRRYGMHHIYMGSQPFLTLYKAEAVEELLSSHTILSKGPQYDLMHSWLGTGLLTSTGGKWKARRKLLTPAFHFRILEDFIDGVNKQSKILAEVLGKQAHGSEDLNVVPKVTLCTLDIICETIMGVSVGAQSHSENDYVKAVRMLGEMFVHRLLSPLLWNDFVFRLTNQGREYFRCIEILHSFTRKVIAERKLELQDSLTKVQDVTSDQSVAGRKYTSRQPFLDLLLMEHLRDSSRISEEDIREEVDTFMFEGHDTTAMGISWALFLIGHHPREQKKIHDELDSIFGDDRERNITADDLKRMPYLECALKESQRIYPSVPFIARHSTGPFTIDGRTVPEGTAVQVAVCFLHKDPKVFPKPEEYHPERFFPENSRGRHPFAYVPFSAGPRNCIGQKFAMMEEKIVIANLLRRYTLKSIDQRDQVVIVAELILRPKNGLKIAFTPR